MTIVACESHFGQAGRLLSKPSSHHKSAKSAKPSAKTSWLRRSVAALFGRKPKADPPATAKPHKARSRPKKTAHPTHPLILTKAETSILPPFPGLTPDRIYVPHTVAECEAAAREILAAGVTGFDTEAKPTFRVGEKSTGPHVVQFALTDCAYIFQLHRPDCQRVAADLIASDHVLKVGFGLNNDHGQIRHRLGVTLHHVLDLDNIFRKRGYKGQIGVRGAIGALMNQSFPKSKKTTTSNWAAPELTTRQLLYAANDAYAALKIMEALNLTPDEIANQQPKPKAPKQSRSRQQHPPRASQGSPA